MNSNKRVKIVVALGSNVNQKSNVEKAQALLKSTFDGMTFGTGMWTEPIGLSESNKFLNVIGMGYTCVNRERVEMALKNIERKCGRRKSLSSKGVIPIDIDLLLFDSEQFHEADWSRPYMQQLLRQLGIE